MPKVTIDGRSIEVPAGTTILQAAEQVGLEVPQMCYHPGLRVVGVCRVCLCKVEGMPKLTTACSTEVRDGMKVGMYVPEAEKARRGVIEFWLLNHPLDCPICDQGGECPLQDIAFDHGPGESRLVEEKVHKDKRRVLGPHVILDEERCILCWRCTRFTQEISGSNHLMLSERGTHTTITTPPGQEFTDPFSGNVVDLCPVGALTSRDFRFRSRVWEMGSSETVCTACSVGCSAHVWSKKGAVERLTARPNLAVNDYWLCDRGRFDVAFAGDPERLEKPLVRAEGRLLETEWSDGVKALADGLAAGAGKGSGQVAALFTRHLSNEEYWAWQRFFRSHLGTNHLAAGRDEVLTPARAAMLARGRLLDSIVQVEGADTVLILGRDLETTHPVYSLRIRKAVHARGVKLLLATPSPEPLDVEAAVVERVATNQAAGWLHALGAAVREGRGEGIAAAVRSAKRLVVLVNAGPMNAAVAEAMEEFLAAAGRDATWKPLFLDDGGNIAGALALGVSPRYFPGYRAITGDEAQTWKGRWGGKVSGTPGHGWTGILEAAARGEIRALLLVNSGRPAHWKFTDEEKGLLDRAPFVAAVDCFADEVRDFADAILPAPVFSEIDATYTTQDGLVQLARRNVIPRVPTTLQILTRVAGHLGAKVKGPSSTEVFRELARDVPSYAGLDYGKLMDGGARGRTAEATGAGAR